ncbi:MAG: hypothetical protein JNK79_17070 [Chitinophagaceae bacterium]|nr:hypothetical protein [Chitinophagaceae bacterium]
MKTKISTLAIGLMAVAVFVFTACNKDESSIASDTASTTDSEIAVAASDSSSGKDSVYLIHDCGAGFSRDSIAQADLPATVTAYLDENYSGYTFGKAFAVSDSAGGVSGYVAVIYFEDKPIGIEFDSAGEFVRLLEQRGFGRHRGRRQ